ncbi:MAG: FliA/WhiG family RNA polymerase sigma factor [Rhodocyclaceae bacterium]|nr:FliA/WhiG family RNA polymerase sigma factor [Rhodocyclaceae bacterium]
MRPAEPRRRLTEAEGEQLLSRYGAVVNAIARSLIRKLPPNVELDDLIQDGYIGLLGALLQATKNRAGGQFQQYISLRIRGAMLDGLRENDPGTPKVRRAMRRVEQAIHVLGHQLGRSPHEEEVARSLGMPLADYQRLLQEAHGYTLLSIEDFDGGDATGDFFEWCMTTCADPVAALQRRALQRQLLIAISDLSEREQQVMSLHYVDELPMRHIAERLSLSGGRISQLHAQAIAKLRAAVIGADDAPALLAPRRRADG